MDFTAHLRNAARSLHHAGHDLCHRAARILRRSEGWQLALYVALGLLAIAVVLPLALALAVVALVVAVVLAWVHEFVFLMRLGDEAFPGRQDKLVWAALMIVLPPIGLLAFWAFRKSHWIEDKPATPTSDDWA